MAHLLHLYWQQLDKWAKFIYFESAMYNYPIPPNNSRIGFHYFPDTLHYRESDLNTWLPVLQSLGASWLTLTAPQERAIPEPFLRGLQSAGIEPILHFDLPLTQSSPTATWQLLMQSYASWGVHYIVLFDRPNLRRAWAASGWAQSDLVERFLDLFIPYAQSVVNLGLVPVFPPLEPGGDYWDTAFLRAALRGLRRRGQQKILDRLAIGAYAWSDNQPLNWGAGGPERWPSARPYFTSPGMQDQRGYRIFDWYTTLVKAELDSTRPILLLAAGSRLGDKINPERQAINAEEHLRQNLGVLRLIYGDAPESPAPTTLMSDSIPHNLQLSQKEQDIYEEVPAEVITSNFWLLSASPESPYLAHAWYQPDGSHLPVVNAIRKYLSSRQKSFGSQAFKPVHKGCNGSCGQSEDNSKDLHRQAIDHYLLLPVYEWGVAEWHLDVIKEFVKKFHPTIGFSTSEAALAKRVTMLGGLQSFDEVVENKLRAAGCEVIRISGNGTSIASQLASQ